MREAGPLEEIGLVEARPRQLSQPHDLGASLTVSPQRPSDTQPMG